MVGVAACGSVSSIKALWETRIRRLQEKEEEQRRRTAKDMAISRSDSASSTQNFDCVKTKGRSNTRKT